MPQPWCMAQIVSFHGISNFDVFNVSNEIFSERRDAPRSHSIFAISPREELSSRPSVSHNTFHTCETLLSRQLKVAPGMWLVRHVESVVTSGTIIIIIQTYMLLVWFGVRRRWANFLFSKNAPVVSQPMLIVSRMVCILTQRITQHFSYFLVKHYCPDIWR